MEINVWTVGLLAMGTAIATGFGAAPFLFVRDMAERKLGVANALAAGLMLAASVVLLWEASTYSMGSMLAGALIGGAAVWLSQRALDDSDVDVGALRGADARKALLIMGVMTAHSFAEGIGVGVSYGGGDELGLFITAAIALHNVPEGLAIALVLVPRGVSPWKAAGWAVVSSLPQPLLAVPAYLAVQVFEPVLPLGLGFAAGAMIMMAALELLPEASDVLGVRRTAVWAFFALIAGIWAQLLLT